MAMWKPFPSIQFGQEEPREKDTTEEHDMVPA